MNSSKLIITNAVDKAQYLQMLKDGIVGENESQSNG